ncbi:hypothetical protein CUJ88_20150 [Paraburkholderia hospita]|uniref:Uncharacterized protein n=1 Tax=Paraburkholderia hospita TaxID=169430 RepID=A0AAN1JHC1_9BURK|nr:hypothetical protein C2L64_30005 [Paraburkholderia hospita]AXF02954.1 hypothetical protein CUJ88_20150 [Paraburkholderia hospita]OUL70705.1 hypothetical protein CA601_46900 [Paraburkholderia hospita]OUL75564.1 hypothetical protein CA602_35810 [Paraburkholderia hospita]OUL92426.1 hypothetical protein CA603_13990 [Paraburkholderia hospita]
MATCRPAAQSTPPAMNDDVRVQLAQEKMTYRYSDPTDREQASISDAKRNALLPHRITRMDLGRYSLSVVRPSF